MPEKTRPAAPGRALLAAGLTVLTLAGPAAVAPSAAAPLAADVEWLRQQTVWIQVTPGGENAFPRNGAGVVLCQVDQRVYVLTANHVVFGKEPNGSVRASLSDVAKIQLSFYRNLAQPVTEIEDTDLHERIEKTPYAGRDLLLLAFDLPEDLAARASLAEPPAAGRHEKTAGRHEKTTGRGPLRAIGNPNLSAGENWVAVEGEWSAESDGRLLHTAPLREGFSGGPLFDAYGSLLGINIESRADGGVALPSAEVRRWIEPRLPAVCLRNPVADAQRRRAAEDAYREALRHVGRQDWDEALAWLDRAIELRSREGGSVHLQGLRYAQYLPRFYRGLVAFHRHECGKALNELSSSEVQGEIEKNDRRYRQLLRLKERMRTGCGGAPAPSATAGNG